MPELIRAGYYRATAVPVNTPDGQAWAQFGESSKGTPQVVLNFEILDGDEAGRRIAWFGYLSEAALQRTVEALRYCGFKGDNLETCVSGPLDQEVQIVVEHEDYNGKTSAKVRWVNRGGGDGYRLEESMSSKALKQFSAKLKNSVRQVPEVGGKKAERTPAPAPTPKPVNTSSDRSPPAADDDIPF